MLGIDPGTRVVGYGAVVANARGPRLFGAGVLKPGARLDVPARLGAILVEFEELLQEVRPDVVVVEQAFISRNLQSALRIGEGRGIILAAAARFGSRIVQFAPAVAKKALVGNGAADKSQVAAMVAETLGLSAAPEPLDATDALALALAHVLRAKHAGRLALPRRC